MRNRFISIVIVGILACNVYGCAQKDEDAFTKIAVYTVDKEQGEEETKLIPNASESAERLMSQESDTIEFFDSQGVYIRLLAEGNEELSESERAKFLAAFGFEDSDPFYVHTEEDGYPFMELYFDEEREIGCGIRYGKNDFGTVICGFAFENCQEASWHARDPFSVLSVYGTTGESRVTDYQENYEYDDEGRLIGFQSTGTPTDIDREGWENIPMIEVGFIYDDQGKLREKEYRHSSTPHLPFGTTYGSQYSYYDESGRLAHTSSYITHGSLEGYYIYQGNSDVPVYYLELDHQYTSWPTFYRFVNRVHNWEFGCEEDVLAEQGLSEEDLFYEYEYAGASDILFRLSLYCDEYVTRGVGFIREYKNGEYTDLEIFTFDGCEQYLKDAAVGQFSVYSDYYINGRETHFLEGETIDNYFRAMELDETHSVSFDYEDGRLMHMYQGLTHGSVDRFYFNRSRPYMLEVDHGFGVSLYKF